MQDQPDKVHSQKFFIILSLFFIVMTIALTVAQSTRQQNLAGRAAGTITNCTMSDSAISNDDEEKKLRIMINNFRSSNGLTELAFQDDLNRAAAWQSNDMAGRKKLDHTDSTGRGSLARIEDCGYAPFAEARENIGEGQKSANDVFTAWKNSPAHKENMLCPNCTQIGLARDRKNNDSNWFWAMTIGSLLPGQENSPTATIPVSTVTPSNILPTQPTDAADNSTDKQVPEPQQNLPKGTTGILAHIIFPGVYDSGNTEPLHPTRPLTVTLLKPNNDQVTEVNGTISFNDSDLIFSGAIALPNTLESGLYLIKLKSDRTLTQAVGSGYLQIEKGKVVDLETVTLPDVDLDENNTINFADILHFKNCLNSDECPERDTDLDDDGVEDVFDFNVFLDIFSTLQGE